MLDRLCILHSRMSGYMAACHRALKRRYDTQLLCIHWPVADNAPFNRSVFDHFDHRYSKDQLSVDAMERRIREFEPEAILMSGWGDATYMSIARRLKATGIPVVAGSDTQWTGSLRQRIGVISSPVYLHRAIDVLWVAGERQRQFAARLGFTGSRCLSGVYACDWDRFGEVFNSRTPTSSTQNFLFVGRFIPRKGLDLLVAAYNEYRNRVEHPWGLVCAGSGDMADQLDDQPGIQNLGFVQPDRLPDLMRSADTFVLPSRKEPWGVVVQEAAATGLPLICSDASGAAVHLLQDGYNGYLCENESVIHLADCMEAVGNLTSHERTEMGRRSHELSKQFMPERWATTLVRAVQHVSRD